MYLTRVRQFDENPIQLRVRSFLAACAPAKRARRRGARCPGTRSAAGSPATPTSRARSRSASASRACSSASPSRARRPGGSWPMLAPTQLSNYLTLKGSFSVVSKPKFARKYALESSRRHLHNALLCTFSKLTPSQSSNFC